MAGNQEDEPTHSSSGEEEVSSEEEGSQSESEPEQEQGKVTKKLSASKPIHPTASVPSASSSSGEDESGSDSGSEPAPDDPPPRKSAKVDPTIKPISSKPMDKPPTKPRSKPTPSASPPPADKSGSRAKRSAPVAELVTDSKRARKQFENVTDGAKKANGSDDPKKQLFQRLWSEEDEVVILKGMSDYTAKKKSDPVTDMNAFHEFIKKSLHVDVTKTQLSAKVRRLKKKYLNNSKKGKSGKEPTFSKRHEQNCYELSKKIWGGKKDEGTSGSNKDDVSSGDLNGTAKRNLRQNSRNATVSNEEDEPVVEKEGDANVELSGHVLGNGNGNVLNPQDAPVKDGWKLVTGAKKIEWEKKSKKVMLEEIEAYSKRLDLMHEQVQLVLKAMKSSQK